MFAIYSEPIFDITRKHDIKIQSYADDTQLYLPFDMSDDMSECVKKMEECVAEIREWMRKNMLKLNDDKTEVLVISLPPFIERLHETHIRIGYANVQASESARNHGVIFDNGLVCRISFMQLRHLRSIKDTLTQDSLEKFTHAFISSRLDYCNALLYGLPQSSISKLQRGCQIVDGIKEI